ncbi:MAG TPA: antiterminator Q family protein [Bryobacteraceae bacterium]|jgi:DNA-directed RNA polymerase specialized sigma24 family protein|nr:antiterminator Q family protein [Bryobacteraceae bacterium]
MTREEYGNAYRDGFHLTMRLLISRGVSPDTAEETAQAAWSRGWERLHQLRDSSLVLTWANSIALNIHRTQIRSESRKTELSPYVEGPGLNTAAIDVKKILSRCRKTDRALLSSYYLHGSATNEIASEHGLTETAVRIRMMRARRYVQDLLSCRPDLSAAAA